MKKIIGLRKFVDNLSSSQNFNSAANRSGGGGGDYGDDSTDLADRLTSAGLSLSKVGRYGFPYHPTCIAVDSVQRLFAIGTSSGAIRICGKPGVEIHLNHNSSSAVKQLMFLVNEGGLVSVCDDASIHLWNLRQAQPALIHTLKFAKERVSCIHTLYKSKWLYVGTERGNIYVVSVENFTLSNYVINWNKAIDVSCKMHPGPVTQICCNPVDESKLLIVYEAGICNLWDLRGKCVIHSYSLEKVTQHITTVKWATDGKRILAGHYDGAFSIWNYKEPNKPTDVFYVHSVEKNYIQKKTDGEHLSYIAKLESAHTRDHDLCLFSGGLSYGNTKKGLTMMMSRSKTLLLSDYVVDFALLTCTPHLHDFQEPLAVIALLKNEVVVFDLKSPSISNVPWFEIPYTFDIHASPVTCLQYHTDCSTDLIAALYQMDGAKRSKQGSSKERWPFVGGERGDIESSQSLLLTGHADGSVKFWELSSNASILIYTLPVGRVLERQLGSTSSSSSISSKASGHELDDPYLVQQISMCVYSRTIAISHASNFVVVYKYKSEENVIELNKLEVNFKIDMGLECEESGSPESPLSISSASSQPTSASGDPKSPAFPLPPTTGPSSSSKPMRQKWLPGFQPAVFCQQLTSDPMPLITALEISSAYGLVAFGNSCGIAVVDYLQQKVVVALMNYELSGPIEVDSPQVTKIPLVSRLSNPHHSTHNNLNSDNHDKKKDRSHRISHSGIEHSKLGRTTSGGGIMKDKEDGLYASRELPSGGVIRTLTFTHSFTRKGATVVCPSLWVGTSTGGVFALVLSIPPPGEERMLQPVIAIATGTQLDCGASALSVHFLNHNSNVIPSPYEMYRINDDAKTPAQSSYVNHECKEKHLAVLCSEREIKVKKLPSMKTLSRCDPVNEHSFILKSDIMTLEGGVCLGCLTSHGHLLLYSLPKLHLLMDVECGVSLSDYRMIKTFTFGQDGEAVFLASPCEVQRIAFTDAKQRQYLECLGSLFALVAPPEPPQKGFFQSLFSSNPSPLDKEELFGPQNGAPSRSIANVVPGDAMHGLKHNTDTVAGAVSRARVALAERGEKLSTLEDRSADMMFKASNFSSAAQALAEKYQKKKWYQL